MLSSSGTQPPLGAVKLKKAETCRNYNRYIGIINTLKKQGTTWTSMFPMKKKKRLATIATSSYNKKVTWLGIKKKKPGRLILALSKQSHLVRGDIARKI